jgi:hypothetical protein
MCTVGTKFKDNAKLNVTWQIFGFLWDGCPTSDSLGGVKQGKECQGLYDLVSLSLSLGAILHF